MKHYKIWQAPVYAFFSTQFYRELGATAKGVGFVYLLVLLSFASAVTPIKEFVSFQSLLIGRGEEICDQLPEISIDGGKLSINLPSPCYVSNPQNNENFLAFDTSGQSSTPSDLNVPVLVTADKIILHTSTGDLEAKIKDIAHFHASPQQLKQWLCQESYLVPLFKWLLALPLIWAGHIVQALGFSLAGLLLARTISVVIKYEGLLRIASVALGNVIILDALIQIFPLDIPGVGLMEICIPNWGLYKFFLAFGFTLFGVGANLSPPGFQPAGDTTEAGSFPGQR